MGIGVALTEADLVEAAIALPIFRRMHLDREVPLLGRSVDLVLVCRE